MPLRVIDPGWYTLLVDQGRRQYRSLGVPVGGAADRTSLALGNALVGNPPDAAGLEICLAGPTLQADCELACVLCGAPFDIRGDRRGALQAGHTFTLAAGEMLHIGGSAVGMRAYLCVRGGFDGKVILGSRSALEPLRAGDEFNCTSNRMASRFVPLPSPPSFSPELATPVDGSLNGGARSDEAVHVLRVLAGTQADWFQLDDFYAGEFSVTPKSNRMGLRLDGKTLRPVSGMVPEMVSEPVCPGAVQVTRDGQCIILGIDGQTIGGYPKIGHVISADLDVLGQLRGGERLRFVRVSLEEAEELYGRRQEKLGDWLMRLGVTA